MKKFLSGLNIGRYVLIVSSAALIVMTILFLIDIFTMKLYHGLHPILWMVLLIIFILMYSKSAHNQKRETLFMFLTAVSIFAVMIDVMVMFVRYIMEKPAFCIVYVIIYILLAMVDSWWFDEKPWFYK